jgi:hypothetical protein
MQSRVMELESACRAMEGELQQALAARSADQEAAAAEQATVRAEAERQLAAQRKSLEDDHKAAMESFRSEVSWLGRW